MRIVIILLLLASCRAPEVLRDKAKAQKYVKKIEALDPSALKVKTDTIFSTYIFTDTVYIESVYKDTLFAYLPGDTIFVQKNGSSARVIFLPNNSARLTLDIPEKSLLLLDSAIVPTSISTVIEVQSKPLYTWLIGLWRKFWWIAVISAIVFALITILKQVAK
jgi:hypothetical protein